MPALNPFKPEGALGSFTVRSLDSGLGFSMDGVARGISIYGLDKMEIQQIEYVHHSHFTHQLNELSICVNYAVNL